MTSHDESQPRSPFSRPGFVVAAVLIGAILVAGVVLAVINATRAGDEPPTTNPTATVTPEPSTPTPAPTAEPADSASICGLEDGDFEGTLSSAPETDWQFQGTTAYPTSPAYGPGATDEDGFRYCFQRSVEGALFAAANAVVQGSDVAISTPWIKYFLSELSPNREQLLDEVAAGSPASLRLNVAGFRILNFDGESARIDVAVEAVGGGNTTYASAIYDLVWEAGDWRLLPQDANNPLRMAELPDISRYVIWTE